MYSSLTNEFLRLSAIRETSRKEFLSLLEKVKGNKVLALDPTIIGALQPVAERSILQEKGVKDMYRISEECLDTDCKNIIFVVRPKVRLMKMIAKNIRYLEKQPGETKTFHVFMVPRKTLVCESILEEEGVYGSVRIHEFELDLIPLDDDVVTMEMDTTFRECFMDGDNTSLYYISRALMKLQNQFGLIPQIRAKGRCSKQVVQMLTRMRQELPSITLTPEIHALYIIDRDVDLITPFVTQLTYEGLIDELWGIKTGIFEPPFNFSVKKDDKKPAANAPKKQKMGLNSNDTVFSEVRDSNFSSVGGVLNIKAKTLEEMLEKRHTMKQLSEIRDFMRKLPELQLEKENLAKHIEIAQEIQKTTHAPEFRKGIQMEQSIITCEDEKEVMDYIEECINRKEPLNKVLRYLALMSAVNNGLKPKVYEFFRREIMQTYGFEVMLTLDNLEKAGIVRRQEGRNNYPSIKKSFRLYVDDINEANPQDIAYVHSGYAPLSVRILEAAVRNTNGWKNIENILSLLPGPLYEENQETAEATSGQRVVMLFFIGGITFAEMSAIRFVNEQLQQYSSEEHGRTHFIVGTTKIINGNTLLESCYERLGTLQATQ